MWIGYRKEIRKLTFRALAPPTKANDRNISFRIYLRWPIDIINPAGKTKLYYLYNLTSGWKSTKAFDEAS